MQRIATEFEQRRGDIYRRRRKEKGRYVDARIIIYKDIKYTHACDFYVYAPLGLAPKGSSYALLRD